MTFFEHRPAISLIFYFSFMKNVDKMFKVFSILSIVLIVGVVCFSSINIGTRLGKYEAITDDAEFVRCYLGLMESEVISDLHI